MRWMDLDRWLLPDESCWGQGFGGHWYTAADLAEIADNVAGTHQTGYGPRYISLDSNNYVRDGRIVFPAGHDATGHPNRRGKSEVLDPDAPTSNDSDCWQVRPELQEFFRARGWTRDQHGRACMPFASQLIGDPRIGLNTGIGYGFYLGENAVVDTVLMRSDDVLLVSRVTDTDIIPALPGGYMTSQHLGIRVQDWLMGVRPVTLEGIFESARRKLLDETGMYITKAQSMELIRGIRPVSSPHTANFWTVTYTVRCRLSASDDARPCVAGARFVPQSELPAVMPQMWPDHRRALQAALQ